MPTLSRYLTIDQNVENGSIQRREKRTTTYPDKGDPKRYIIHCMACLASSAAGMGLFEEHEWVIQPHEASFDIVFFAERVSKSFDRAREKVQSVINHALVCASLVHLSEGAGR